MSEGRANTARGAAQDMRYGGARGQLTVRADSGFYDTVVAACREMDVRFSITIRQRARSLIEAYSHSLLDGRRPMSPRRLTPRSRPSRTPRRCGSLSGG